MMRKKETNLHDTTFQTSILHKLLPLQMHPELKLFEEVKNDQLLKELNEVELTGTYSLFKFDPKARNYYGARIDLDPNAFNTIVKICEKHGLKEPGDSIGSEDRKPHVTVVQGRDIQSDENYKKLIEGFEKFSKEYGTKEKVSAFTNLYRGYPQTGKLYHALVANLALKNFNNLRRCVGQKPIEKSDKIQPHTSIFSRKVQPYKGHVFTNKELEVIFYSSIPEINELREILEEQGISIKNNVKPLEKKA